MIAPGRGEEPITNALCHGWTLPLLLFVAWLLTGHGVDSSRPARAQDEDGGAGSGLPSRDDQALVTRWQDLLARGDARAREGAYHEALLAWKDAFEQYLEGMRGLRFRHGVPARFMGRDELAGVILEELKRDFPPAEMESLRKALRVFGLAPADFDPATAYPRIYTEEVGGFYDPRRRSLFLISEVPAKPPETEIGRLLHRAQFDPEEQKIVLVHELCHALADQNYDLDAMGEKSKHDDDRAAALTALMEGEATAAMFAYSSGESFLQTPPDVAAQSMAPLLSTGTLMSGEALRNAPRIVREGVVFPYGRGLVFVLALTNGDKGWQRVDEAFRSPPLSTEHILHPEKYVAREPAYGVDLAGVAGAAGVDWREVDQGVLGEIGISILLDEHRIKDVAALAAGWAGDGYMILDRVDGGLAFAFATTWDTEADAVELADAWRRAQWNRSTTGAPGGDPPSWDGTRSTLVAAEGQAISAASAMALERRGDRVFIVEGIAADRVAAVIEHMASRPWQAKRWEPIEYRPREQF